MQFVIAGGGQIAKIIYESGAFENITVISRSSNPEFSNVKFLKIPHHKLSYYEKFLDDPEVVFLYCLGGYRHMTANDVERLNLNLPLEIIRRHNSCKKIIFFDSVMSLVKNDDAVKNNILRSYIKAKKQVLRNIEGSMFGIVMLAPIYEKKPLSYSLMSLKAVARIFGLFNFNVALRESTCEAIVRSVVAVSGGVEGRINASRILYQGNSHGFRVDQIQRFVVEFIGWRPIASIFLGLTSSNDYDE